MLTPIPMVFFMSEFAAPTTIPNTPASSSSTATGILSRPEALGKPVILFASSACFRISLAEQARLPWRWN